MVKKNSCQYRCNLADDILQMNNHVDDEIIKPVIAIERREC
jgi:hypothetical protein